MKRLAVLLLALAAVAPATASAGVPCRDRIYNDWYPDGKIKTTYPISCYRDALKHMRTDLKTYSSLGDDIRLAMQAALARREHHTRVPVQVGKSGPAERSQASASSRVRPGSASSTSSTDSSTSGPQQADDTIAPSTIAAGQESGSSGGSSVPVPLLVLGALALLLVAVGAAGVVAKRRRS